MTHERTALPRIESPRPPRLSALPCTIAGVKSKLDSIFLSCALALVTALGVWQVGADLTTGTLLGAAGGAGILACWKSTQHLAQWLAGGVAAVSGALLTLVTEAAMNGAPNDPSTSSLVFAFAGAAAVSGVVHNRTAKAQLARDRELDRLLVSLPTAASVSEMEQRISAALEQRAGHQQSTSWTAWWATRPSKG